MALHKLLNNFTGGELSPQLDARIDLQKYDTGCKQLRNFRIQPYGGAQFRSGTKYIAEIKDSTQQARVIPFVVSTAVAFALELGPGYIRFYKNGARIENPPGTPVEVAVDYAASEIFQVQYKQINDVMYLTHGLTIPG